MEFEKLDAVPFSISREELRRRIGADGGSRLSPRVRGAVERASDEVRERADAAGLYRVVPVEMIDGTIHLDGEIPLESERLAEVLAPCEHAVVFLATIGPEIDDAIEERMEERPHYGCVLDAAASAAAESVAEFVQEEIDERLDDGLKTTLRYSPGYCDWPLDAQEALFEVLPSDEIGVELSDDCLMSPRKTVSGIIGICPDDLARSSGSACRQCPKTSCPHRRE